MYLSGLIVLLIPPANCSLKGKSVYSSLRNSLGPLLSWEHCAILLTNMDKSFYYMVEHMRKDIPSLVTNSSKFYSSFHAIAMKLFMLSPIVAFYFLRPLLAFTVRQDDHCSIGIFVLNSIIQLVSLGCKNQGIDSRYGDVYNGNYSSHVSGYPCFLDFMFTWYARSCFVETVAIDCVYLVFVPHPFLSVRRQSYVAILLIFLLALMHSFVFSSHLLHGLNTEVLRVLSAMKNSYCRQSISTSHVSVLLGALVHAWQVKDACIVFPTALMTIKHLPIVYLTFWGLPWSTCDVLPLVLWLVLLQLDFNSRLHLMIMENEAILVASALSSSAIMRIHKVTEEIHAALCKTTIHTDLFVASALIGMCLKFGISFSPPDVSEFNGEISLEKTCLVGAEHEREAMVLSSYAFLSVDDLKYQLVKVLGFLGMTLTPPFSKLLTPFATDVCMVEAAMITKAGQVMRMVYAVVRPVLVQGLRTCLLLRGEEC